MTEEPKGDDIHLNAAEEAEQERVWKEIDKQGLPPRRPLPGQPKSMKARQEAKSKD